MRREHLTGAALVLAVLVLLGSGIGALPAGAVAPGADTHRVTVAGPIPPKGPAGPSEPSPAGLARATLANGTIEVTPFTEAPAAGVVPLDASFSLDISRKPAATAPVDYTVHWTFGNSTPKVTTQVTSNATGVAVAYYNETYSEAGTYTANATVSDSIGDQSGSTRKLLVYAETGLVVRFTTSLNPMDLGIAFSALAVVSGGIPPYTYLWQDTPAGCSGVGANLTCTPSATGHYYPFVGVTDAHGLHTSAFVNYTVNPTLVAQPVAVSWFYCNGSAGVLQENLSAVVAIDPTTMGPTGTGIDTFRWDFGDGTPNSTLQTVDHVFALGATYSVSLLVTDQGGGSSSSIVNVSTSYAGCHTVASVSYTPPLVLLQGGVIALIVAVIVLLALIGRKPKDPPTPVNAWESRAANPADPAGAGPAAPPSGASGPPRRP